MAWNTSAAPAAENRSRSRSSGKYIILALVVLAIIAAAVWYFLGGKAAPADKSVRVPDSTGTIEVAQHEQSREAEEVAEESEEDRAKRERREMLKKMSVDERIDFLFDEAAKKPINLEPASNRVFATGTEQVMSWIFTTKLGDVPPPLPRISIRDEAHLAEILMNQNEIKDTDSEKAAEAKEMVMLAKDELKKFIKEGGNIDEFLEYYRGELVQAHQEWQDSQKQVMQVIKEEPEIAADFIAEINKRLDEKGIKHVKVPPKLAEQIGLEE